MGSFSDGQAIEKVCDAVCIVQDAVDEREQEKSSTPFEARGEIRRP